MMNKITYKNEKQDSETKTGTLSHRGVSEIIVTLILLSVTVVGAVLVFTAFQGTGINEQMGALSGAQKEETLPSIKLIGHDTRDGLNLVAIADLDNTNDGKLTDGELVVFHVRNTGTDEFPIERIDINEINHGLDESGSGSSISSGSMSKGSFKLINNNNDVVKNGSTVFPGAEARIVVKLSDEFSSSGSEGPISLNEHMRVVIYPIEGVEVFEIIEAGSLG